MCQTIERFRFLLCVLLICGLNFAYATDIPKKEYVLNNLSVVTAAGNKVFTLKTTMNYYKVPAVSFSVIQKGKIVWVNSVGFIDSKHTKKVDNDTLFQIGSMTKPIAALAALRLVEKGVLRLDQPLNPKLHGWKIPLSKRHNHSAVTLRQLLSMSSGLNIGGYYGFKPGERLPTLIQTLSGSSPAAHYPVKITYKPGTKYAYSGGGYEVAQLLMQSQTKMSFPRIVNKMIFNPLAMTNSNCQQPLTDTLGTNAAFATDADGKSFPYKWRVTPEYAASGMWSTATDMAKFVLAIMKSYNDEMTSFLSQRYAKQMLTRQHNTPYGLGFVVEGEGKTLHFMKLGQNAGYQGWLIGFPNTGQGAVVLTNSDNGRKLAQALIYSIAKAYKWPTRGKLKDAWMIR